MPVLSSSARGLGVGLERALRLAELEALGGRLGLGLLLGEAHHGDLGVGEARGGNGVVVNCVLAPNDVLYSRDALSGGGVCKHHLAVGVADAVQVGHHLAAGLVKHLHLLVDLDEAAHSLDTLLVELQALRVGHAPGADQGGVHVQGRVGDLLLGLGVNQLDLDWLLARLAGEHLSGKDGGVAVHLAGLDEDAVGNAADVGVEGGHEVVHGLDEGHLGAEGGVDVGELEPDVARADDGNPVRHPLELQRVVLP